MDKFGRNYVLHVQAADLSTDIEIKLPFSIDFNIIRDNFSRSNTAVIRIYNLSSKTREQIRFDKVDVGGIKRPIELRAGYGSNMPIIFRGEISEAFSVREGVNFITQISAFDGGYAVLNGLADELPPFKAGTPIRTIILALIKRLPGISVGAIGDFPGVLSKGQAFSGNIVDVLNTLTNNSFNIDNGKAYALNDNEVITGDIAVIDSESGLLGTPKRENSFINFDILFEPRIVIGQSISLKSVTAESFNGNYSVSSVSHKGMISETVSGSAITSVGLQALKGVFTKVGNG